MYSAAVRWFAGFFAAATLAYGLAQIFYASLPAPTGTPPDAQGIGLLLEQSLVQILRFYPVVFLAVGLTVILLRPGDIHALIMAGLFACFMAVPAFPRAAADLPRGLSTFVPAYRALALSAIPTLFFGFFATFPTRSPFDLRVPWLKWAYVVGWALFALPNLATGGADAPAFLVRWLGESGAEAVRLGYLLSGVPLGTVSLVSNVVAAPTSDARRKARVLLWGTLVGVGPIIAAAILQMVIGVALPAWLFSVALVMVFWFPLSFAYAVVKHRVLDVPVLLKRGARYLLVRRGLFVLLALLGMVATTIFTAMLTRLFEARVELATSAGVVFGMALALSALPLVRRATSRIDRAFFRSAYDATAILENLAETIPQVASRDELARLLEDQITQALRPVGIVVFLQDADGRLHVRASRWHRTLPPLAPDLPWLLELAAKGRPWDVSAGSSEAAPAVLRDSPAECLVPILGHDRRLLGFIVVGATLSEQPYSRDDKRLLLSAAHQAGVALENIRLARDIAERLDVERATAREIEIARQVQVRLFPQRQPAVETLDYAGGCVQARHVGGDYYDFVELGPGHVGLVVADVAGKGIGAALLMANLQANLRAQFAGAAGDLPRLLRSVNKLFYENTSDEQYATLVLADYEGATRRLRYANCGHFPPLLVHADGSSERLTATATVLGLFEQWEVTTCERVLERGDLLVIYTDGMIEATNRVGEEFGVEQLLTTIKAHRALPAAALVRVLHEAVQAFTGGVPTDDLTVVVAHVL